MVMLMAARGLSVILQRIGSYTLTTDQNAATSRASAGTVVTEAGSVRSILGGSMEFPHSFIMQFLVLVRRIWPDLYQITAATCRL
jgi:hypothetical protein